MIWHVYVTPESGVGGEWPQPARITRKKKVAVLYARACRKLGQQARVVPMRRR